MAEQAQQTRFLIDDFSDTEFVEYAIANLDGQYAGLPGSGTPTIVRYDGTRWVVDGEDHLGTVYLPFVFSHIREQIDARLAAGAYSDEHAQAARGFASRLGNTKSIESIEKYTRKQLRRYGAQFAHGSMGDATTRWYFNCLNGTFDLQTDTLIAHDPRHYITQIAPVEYDPDATAPTFAAFLHRILPDAELRGYVQELLGYALNGHMRDPVLPLLIGTGANGKSTLLNTVRRVMGDDYALMSSPDLFNEKGGDQHPTKRMALKGKRFVITNETGEGMKLNEAAVKQFTSTEPINARSMRQDPVTFDPTHLVVMSTNYAPRVTGGDKGLWRRIKEIPFHEYIPHTERDTSLEDKLVHEASGILNWLIEGHRRWRERDEKFNEPDVVTVATEAYRKESDPIGAFMRDYFEFDPELWTPSATIWSTFLSWADDEGMAFRPTQNGLMSKIRRPYNLVESSRRVNGSKVRGWAGLGLKGDDGDEGAKPHNTPSPSSPESDPDPSSTASDRVFVDLETTGLNPQVDKVRLLVISEGGPTEVYDMFDPDACAQGRARLAQTTDKTFVAHNASFDLGFLEGNYGYKHRGPVFCTMTAAQIADAGRNPAPAPPMFVRKTKAGKDVTKNDTPYSLRSVVHRLTGKIMSKDLQVSGWGDAELSDEQREYAKGDVDVLKLIVDRLRDATAGVGTVELDMLNVKISASLYAKGVRFDKAAWLKLAEPHKVEIARIDAELNALNGEPGNWNSTPQKLELLRKVGVRVPNAQADTIKARRNDHRAAALLSERAEHFKLATTYGADFVAKNVDALGRIRSTYRVAKAATGRYTSSGPNLQNIPRDDEYRACFLADPGTKLVGADFSQIEVRYIAGLSGDTALQAALATGDVYKATAAKMLGVPFDDVSKEQRQLAKAVVLGLQYGMGALKFQKYARDTFNVVMSRGEAETFKARFFQAYPTLKAWQRDVGDPFDYNVPDSHKITESRTYQGRVRRDIKHYTERINTPVQAAGADALKLALAELYERGYDIALHVHDEIVVRAHEDDAQRVAGELQDIMQRAALEALTPDCRVAVPAEPGIGYTWAATK